MPAHTVIDHADVNQNPGSIKMIAALSHQFERLEIEVECFRFVSKVLVTVADIVERDCQARFILCDAAHFQHS